MLDSQHRGEANRRGQSARLFILGLLMRWPIRYQIFVPFAVLLVVAVLGGALLSSRLAARRAGAIELQRLEGVTQALQAADFPYTPAVLTRMKGLSGADYVATDSTGRVLASTLSDTTEVPAADSIPSLQESTRSLEEFPTRQVGETYFLTAIESPGRSGLRHLAVLYPRETWDRLQWDAAWPPLLVGCVVLLLMLIVSGWLAHRIGQRVGVVRAMFAELEAGRFPRIETPVGTDELQHLLESANHLSQRLERLHQEIVRTEKLRTLAQLAAGLAHQLRNAITGARMGIQLHQRRCAPAAGDDSLQVALNQLQLTEQQIQGLLSLSRNPQTLPEPGQLRTILDEVRQLVGPQMLHHRMQFDTEIGLPEHCPVRNRNALRGALLNLVLNALEAAGVGGTVRLLASQTEHSVSVEVVDSGSGPAAEVRDRLFDPFVTSKPEGVGLGLVLAQQAAEEEGGQITWWQAAGMTHFCLSWPSSDHPADESVQATERLTAATA